jgi:aspartyl-tRNA(Asn)/glutamyl-tRNA(Gln) amidotransferase subunit A
MATRRDQPSIATAAFQAAMDELATWEASPVDRRPLFWAEIPPDPAPAATAAPGALPSAGRIADARSALESGARSCRDLVEEALGAIERDSDQLGAFVQVLADEAREEADRLDHELRRGHRRGALHGIPFSVKDVIDVAGAETRAGSDAYLDRPTRDAWAVARLRERGAIVLGKVTTHEFALGVTTPQARNPHDPSRIPGGSSGGSGIAVSTGMGLVSIGTDTRASTRVPASLCGVVGLKPTIGAIPTDGVVPLSWTMDHVGILAPTVEDAAVVFDALVDRVPPVGQAAGRSVAGLRAGVPDAAFDDIDPDVESSVREALDLLADLELDVASVSQPDASDYRRANAMGLIVSRCEAATFHRTLGADRSRYWEETRDQLDAADRVLALDYIQAQRFRGDLRERMLAVFADRDILAMATTLVPAPPVERASEYLMLLSRNAIPWSFLGFPVLSVPCRPTPAGLPVGLQLVGPPHAEDRLIAVGAAFAHARSSL